MQIPIIVLHFFFNCGKIQFNNRISPHFNWKHNFEQNLNGVRANFRFIPEPHSVTDIKPRDKEVLTNKQRAELNCTNNDVQYSLYSQLKDNRKIRHCTCVSVWDKVIPIAKKHHFVDMGQSNYLQHIFRWCSCCFSEKPFPVNSFVKLCKY